MESSRSMNTKRVIKIMVAGCVALLCVYVYSTYFSYLTPESLRLFIDKYDKWAPLAYIALWVVLPTFFFPVPVLALAGGLSFGLLDGSLYTLVGAFLNSTLMFGISRYLDNGAISGYLTRKLPPKAAAIFTNFDGAHAFRIIFLLRLIPLVPYNLINYAAGLTTMRFVPYTLATMLGIIPGTIVFINLGDAALDISSPKFIFALILLVLLVIASDRLARKTFPAGKKTGA